MNPERAILGLAAEFGKPDLNDREVWYPWQFEAFAGSGHAADIRLEHRAPIMPEEQLGTWRSFAIVPKGSTPPGLLALGYFGYSPSADVLLEQVGRELDLLDIENTPWGMSVTAADVSDAEDGSRMWVSEISLTRKPAHPRTRVLGVGQHALDRWELLTGTPPPTVTPVGPRTVVRRLRGIVGGRLVFDEWEA